MEKKYFKRFGCDYFTNQVKERTQIDWRDSECIDISDLEPKMIKEGIKFIYGK